MRGPALAPEGSPADRPCQQDAPPERGARLVRRAVAGGLLGGDSALRDGDVVSPPGRQLSQPPGSWPRDGRVRIPPALLTWHEE